MRASLTEARVKSLPQMRVVVPHKHVPLIGGLARIVPAETDHRDPSIYWWAGGFALSVQLLKIPLSDTMLWHGFARSLVSLAG